MLDSEFNFGVTRIKAGFKTDLTSVPILLRPLLGEPDDPKISIAGLIHDWLYDIHCALPIDKAEADSIFYHLLVLFGTNVAVAKAMHLTVTLFGGKHYKQTY